MTMKMNPAEYILLNECRYSTDSMEDSKPSQTWPRDFVVLVASAKSLKLRQTAQTYFIGIHLFIWLQNEGRKSSDA